VNIVTDDIPETGEEFAAEPEQLIRQQSFDVDGPIEVDVVIGSGRVRLSLSDEPGVDVQLQHDPDAANPWMNGIANLVEWFRGGFAGGGFEGAPSQVTTPREAVEQTRIELIGRRLVVHTPKQHLRLVPVTVTVRAPAGSSLELRSDSGDITATGPAGRVGVHTGSGDVALDRADGPADVHTGSGALRLGPMLGGLQARSGSGEIEVSSVGGPSKLTTGSGDIWLGSVQSDVQARSGSGDLTVADAACGDVTLTTGSGDVRIGVRAGTVAMVDLTSGSGEARSELGLSDRPPADGPKLRVRGRTGSGNAVISSAVG
jgi:Putative adhesin